MMPDLGKYAFAVLASYGLTIGLFALTVLGSLWQSQRVKRQLAEVEARQEKSHG